MLVAGTELKHPPLRALTRNNKGSDYPELYGVDIMFMCRGKRYGVQRKEVKDFVASVNDGRLATDVQKMQALEQGIVVVEGEMRFSLDGAWLGGGFQRWDRTSHLSALLSIQNAGVWCLGSSSTTDTAEVCRAFERWVKKGSHTMLRSRPGPPVQWGKAKNRDYQRHLVMGLPGVGVELAARIVHEFDGVPWTWKDGALERLLGVEGIGAKTVAKFSEAVE